MSLGFSLVAQYLRNSTKWHWKADVCIQTLPSNPDVEEKVLESLLHHEPVPEVLSTSLIR